MSPDRPLPPERDEPAIVSSPAIVAEEMADATQRLRERAWMISAHSVRAVYASSTRTRARAARAATSA